LIMQAKKTVTIADLARLYGVNKSAVNYWVAFGLLTPSGIKGKATKMFVLGDAKKQISAILNRSREKELKDLL